MGEPPARDWSSRRRRVAASAGSSSAWRCCGLVAKFGLLMGLTRGLCSNGGSWLSIEPTNFPQTGWECHQLPTRGLPTPPSSTNHSAGTGLPLEGRLHPVTAGGWAPPTSIVAVALLPRLTHGGGGRVAAATDQGVNLP